MGARMIAKKRRYESRDISSGMSDFLQKGEAVSDESYHMTPQQFREFGREAVDWIADYYENIENLPVLSQVGPGEVRRQFPAKPASTRNDSHAILEDMIKSSFRVSLTGNRQISLPISLPMRPDRQF